MVGKIGSEHLTKRINRNGKLLVVLVQDGAVLVGPSVAVTIEIVKAALQRKISVISARPIFELRREMPLPDCPCGVATLLQSLCK